jgi:hypothetical protein
MTTPNPIQQGNGVNMFVRLWRSFVLGSVCLVLLGIEMVLISLQTFLLLRMQGLHFGRVEIILFCTFVWNFAFIKVNSESKYVQLTTTIVANWNHIYFLPIKRKDFYLIYHSTLSVIKLVYCCLHKPVSYFQMAAISNGVPPSSSPSPPLKTKSCFFLKFYLKNSTPMLT